ncbi:MAG: biotin--[acetyl-CoA-carboxylase] ligase [Burkholderiales bacterium]|nr:biotin--[acetyl-CoA-carboxylase] ligase [Burkholderiales bacterium]
MNRTFKVLRLLADGNFHSGETLAHALGVSRGSVWHAVRALGAAGLDIYRVRGRGYRLARPLSLLDRDAVLRELGSEADHFTLRILDETDSTSTLLMAHAQAGTASGTVIAAEWQTAGRGRMGRAWHAGAGGALTFSLLWRFSQGAGFLSGLSLAVGVALTRAFEVLGVAGAGLKWPNDVLWQGGKLAGILIEMQGDMLGPSAAVIGVGINVRVADAVRGRIDQRVADLESACGKPLDRNAVLALLLQELRRALDVFAREGFAPFREEWSRRHVYQDRGIMLLLPGTRRESGIARGVAEDGALLVETHGGVMRFHSGEVSLRPEGAEK